jgi:hypothetical protein
MPQALAPSIFASANPFESLPLTIDQKSSRACALVMLALVVPALCAVILPVAIVLVLAAQEVWEAMRSKPVAVSTLAVGLVVWTALFLIPAKRIIQRGWNHRSVRITTERVTVSDRGLFGSKLWTAPLVEFRGITHHVRATLSGVSHELILLHSVADRSVLLHTSDGIARSTIERAVALLCLPEIPACELYRLTRRGSSPLGITPHAEAQAA